MVPFAALLTGLEPVATKHVAAIVVPASKNPYLTCAGYRFRAALDVAEALSGSLHRLRPPLFREGSLRADISESGEGRHDSRSSTNLRESSMKGIPSALGLTVLVVLASYATGTSADDPFDQLLGAAEKGRTGKIRILLERGVDVNKATDGGVTPLMVAATNGKLPAVKLLIKKGADVNAVSKRGLTALMGAAMTGAAETVELLLSHGADVHAKDKDGDTALKWASRGGFVNVVRLLTAHGAKE